MFLWLKGFRDFGGFRGAMGFIGLWSFVVIEFGIIRL